MTVGGAESFEWDRRGVTGYVTTWGTTLRGRAARWGRTAGGWWAAAQLDASPQPVAMTTRGLRWETRWTPPQRARLALASVSPLHHRAAQRLLRAGRPREVG